jgi:hypothetical protein
MKVLTDEEVIDRAAKWARLHRNEKRRDRMDECLDGLSKADQRRVYLCGQRIAGGLPPKVIPAATTATNHVTPAVAQADAQSDAGERMSAKKGKKNNDQKPIRKK